MKTPKEWDVTLKEGIVTSEMVAACAMAATSRYQKWRNNYAQYSDDYIEKPTTARKARMLNAERMVDFYARQRQTLLSFATPSFVRRMWSDKGNMWLYYVAYEISGHHFDVLVNEDKAFKLVDTYQLDVLQVSEAPSNTYPDSNLASFYLVNRVVATVGLFGLNYVKGQDFVPPAYDDQSEFQSATPTHYNDELAKEGSDRDIATRLDEEVVVIKR
jgi:hypothetical protein